MAVRAKMLVQTITLYTSPVGAREVRMAPVYGDDKANKSWSEATPSGECRMFISNPEAAKQFETGQFWFVDFSPATKDD